MQTGRNRRRPLPALQAFAQPGPYNKSRATSLALERSFTLCRASLHHHMPASSQASIFSEASKTLVIEGLSVPIALAPINISLIAHSIELRARNTTFLPIGLIRLLAGSTLFPIRPSR
jgi:hypothetical protein